MSMTAANTDRHIKPSEYPRAVHVRVAVHSWCTPVHLLLVKRHACAQPAAPFTSNRTLSSDLNVSSIPISVASIPCARCAFRTAAAAAVAAAAAATAGKAAATQAAVAVTTPAVALDLEYAHYTIADGRHISVPAWVAVVDQHCALLIKTFICHEVEDGAKWMGGVTTAACLAAPSLQTVLQQLQGLTAGQLLLGHGLAKDLSALGLDHPVDRRFDTMTHPAFCNQSGNSRNLKQLAKQYLAQDIQIKRQPQQQHKQQLVKGTLQVPQVTSSPQQQRPQQQHQQQQPQQPQQQQQPEQHQQQPPPQQQPQQQQGLSGAPQQAVALSRSGHDPEEDASVVMRLYQQVIYPSTYEGQVSLATAQLLESMQLKQSEPPHAEQA